jgi:hypothetical protein
LILSEVALDIIRLQVWQLSHYVNTGRVRKVLHWPYVITYVHPKLLPSPLNICKGTHSIFWLNKSAITQTPIVQKTRGLNLKADRGNWRADRGNWTAGKEIGEQTAEIRELR